MVWNGAGLVFLFGLLAWYVLGRVLTNAKVTLERKHPSEKDPPVGFSSDERDYKNSCLFPILLLTKKVTTKIETPSDKR